jgi:hypothetical protein
MATAILGSIESYLANFVGKAWAQAIIGSGLLVLLVIMIYIFVSVVF